MQQSQLQFDPSLSASDASLQEVLLAAGQAEPGHHDELQSEQGELRPAWRRFFGLLASEGGLTELAQRSAQVARQIRRDGITYNVYRDAAGVPAQRPWPLGLLPLLIEPDEWREIEAGVAQRARLLEALLADCYGPQHLLREGLLPPALLLGHPGYLRALQGVEPPGGVRLHVTAFDIARGPQDSGWWVVSQRTQAPSGLGYVLENRLIVSRQFPEAFRELRVQHLASAYRRLLDTMLALAAPLAQADGLAAPQLVLLTPGPYNETYFEQTYLARYLGLPLVEGGDLTVRDDRLYLKTVQGLEPVHGLLRRLDDDWCDPLELRPDSALGVPGLLQVVRAGKVVMANALGAGFLESPGIQGFLPGIASRLFGEELGLPSLPTWWCGEDAAWDATRDSLGERVVRPTYPGSYGVAGRSFEPEIASLLSPAQLAEWRARIEAWPDAHTLQRYLPFGQTPWWENRSLQPRTAMLRVYAIADGHGGFRVLPGGMTRIAARGRHAVSIQRGGASIDTWVLTDGPVDTYSMLPQRLKPEEIARYRRPVSSRTAENLFWMGRYTERTEHLVRLALVAEALVEDDDDTPLPVLDAVSDLAELTGLAPHGVPSLAQSPRVFERAVIAAVGDVLDSRSIAYNLAALDRAAASLRDRLSSEHARLVRTMAEDFTARLAWGQGGDPPHSPSFGAVELEAALEHLATQLAAVTGAQGDRMTRDDGWRLLTIGRLAERLIAMSDTLQVFFAGGAVHGSHGFDLLLGLFDSTITYRARHPGRQEALALLELLVMDEANPRSLGCVLRRLRTEIGKLPTAAGPVEGLLALLPPFGAGCRLDELCDVVGDEVSVDDARVVALGRRLAEAGARLSDEVGHRYFALSDLQEQRLAV